MNQSYNTPILLLIFNRPDKVRRLVETLSAIKPAKLYIAGDGPRTHKDGEKEACQKAREVATAIPWECEVKTRFLDENQGCKKAVSGAVTWFFENEPEGIVLEDDCLPNPSFFTFCARMLERYRNDEQIMHINGTSFVPATKIKLDAPFYYSRIAHSWGWASWRRAWQKYDGDMTGLNDFEDKLRTEKIFSSSAHITFWARHFKHILDKKVNSWANPWAYSIMNTEAFCITPQVNLVRNIGFDEQASHTKAKPKYVTEPQPLEVAGEIAGGPNSVLDGAVMDMVFMPSLSQKIKSILKKCYDAFTSVLKTS